MIILKIQAIPGMSPVAFMPDYGDDLPDPSLPEDERPMPKGLMIIDQASGIVIELALQEEERRAIVMMLTGQKPVQTATADQMPGGGIHIPGR